MVEAASKSLFDYDKLASLYDTVKTPVASQDEQSVAITELYVHPIRSIRALPASSIFIGPFGIKFDREIALFDVDERKIICAKLQL
jgi:hypothetical protein